MREWRVLIVEDDVAVAGVHSRYVAARPRFRVVGIARSAGEARSLVDIHSPDLILLDLGLPGVDGIGLLRALRTSGPSVEVIVITAHSRPQIVRAAVQLGVVDYLVKPFWPDRLADALEAFELRARTFSENLLSQDAVDRVRVGGGEQSRHAASDAKRQRSTEIEQIIAKYPDGLTADELARFAGISRVTARRYLEELVQLGRCTVDEVAEGPGRPHKHYRSRQATKLGTFAPSGAPSSRTRR